MKSIIPKRHYKYFEEKRMKKGYLRAIKKYGQFFAGDMARLFNRWVAKNSYEHYIDWVNVNFGPKLAWKNAILMTLNEDEIGYVKKSGIKSKLFIRPGTTDLNVFRQIFVNKEYDIDIDYPELIVDAGAHIGLASAYFANKYPESKIISIEPEESNFKLLEKNVEKYSNVYPIKAGLWSHESNLTIKNKESKKWGFNVEEGRGEAGIDSISVGSILEMTDKKQIDVLKLDIEGAEREVFEKSSSWIGDVKTIIVELHERYAPGCTKEMEEAIRDCEFRKDVKGENVVLRRSK